LLVKIKRFLASVLSSVVNLDTDRLGNLCVDASSLQLLKSETSSKLGGLVVSSKKTMIRIITQNKKLQMFKKPSVLLG